MIGNGKIVVLMLGGARRVSMGELLIDSGKRLGYDVEILSYELEESVPIAAIGTVVIGKKWRDADVVEHLVAHVGFASVVNDIALKVFYFVRVRIPSVIGIRDYAGRD